MGVVGPVAVLMVDHHQVTVAARPAGGDYDAAIRRRCLKYIRQLRPLYSHGVEVNTRRDWRIFRTMMRLFGPRFTLWLAAHAKKG